MGIILRNIVAKGMFYQLFLRFTDNYSTLQPSMYFVTEVEYWMIYISWLIALDRVTSSKLEMLRKVVVEIEGFAAKRLRSTSLASGTN